MTAPTPSEAETSRFHHVGVTVPNIKQATEFFAAVLDADVLYDVPLAAVDEAQAADVEPPATRMGIPAGSRIAAIRMLQVANLHLELFEYEEQTQRPAARPCDLGIQHVAFYVDDIHRAVDRLRAAGGSALAGPGTIGNPLFGTGHLWWYCIAPWGTTIELLSAEGQPQPSV